MAPAPGLLARIRLMGGATDAIPSEWRNKNADALKFGVLGAANIAPNALIAPATMIPNAQILGIAARSREKAEAFAKQHQIPKVYGSYDELLADPEIEAVYIPSPNSHHAEQTIASLRAGKHVLCEKPLTANATEARALQKEFRAINANRAASNLPVLQLYEAFHTLSHPLSGRVRQLIREHVPIVTGATVRNVMPFKLFKDTDIRYDVELAGGATMDFGCYAIVYARRVLFSGFEGVPKVLSAVPTNLVRGVDEGMKFGLEFEKDGKKAKCDATVSLNGPFLGSMRDVITFAEVVGTNAAGEATILTVKNYISPSPYHVLTVECAGRKIVDEKIYADVEGKGWLSTYYHQLNWFVRRVRGEVSDEEAREWLTAIEDSIENMTVIDGVYEASGLGIRKGRVV
ncbi:hypothetical protein BJ742DRAFT_758597 [Cladochytrium replicatum]|nr:hypothetical protein BJ742DRAFT_758597 [Cladochytrium replicatum]